MKPTILVSCPIDTWSGYGARSRDIVKSLIALGKYDVKILGQRWGNTPFGFLKADNKEHKEIMDRIVVDPSKLQQPDIWIQITIPSEFQGVGKFNIGITAGIETTICDASWIDGCNKMNLVLTSSEHAKEVFQTSAFEKRSQQNPNQVIEVIKLKTPIEVLFEGVDTNIYKVLPELPKDSEIKNALDSIKEDFCYLFVGHWLQGTMGQDRKDVGMLVKTFLETFKDKKFAPALILKTNGATYSILDKEEILHKIDLIRSQVKGKQLPNVYVIHGELEDNEINELYNHPKVKAMVSFTKGEGYGRPLLEFTTSQKPVIASDWSGHRDFLKQSILLPGEIKQVHSSAVVPNMIIPESSWFTVNYGTAASTLNHVWVNYYKLLDNAKKQSYISKTEFSLDKMKEKLGEIIDKNIPKVVPITLPKLGSNLPTLKKL